jgi:[protein-PII] uridylyltransferase
LPELSRIMQALPKPEVAYLGALFHDIAKGRGGDHSELGASDAEAFCLEQGLSRYDARLVAWLVKNHLILSVTAQKKDITDPQVILEFAKIVGDQSHLDYLYVLTVSDVRGTNPKLWNNWKAKLFQEFYARTKQALRRGVESPIDKEELIAETQQQARELLAQQKIDSQRVESIWQNFKVDAYFLRQTPEEIAWHTRLVVDRKADDTTPLVAIEQKTGRGGTAILTYTSSAQHSFAHTTALLDQVGLNIVDARVTPLANGFSLDIYHVLEEDGRELSDPIRIRDLSSKLRNTLAVHDDKALQVTRRAPRQVRMFTTRTQVSFSEDDVNHRTIVDLVAGDRPGLLSEVGKVFMQQRIHLHTAKIATLGERAEDVFYVTNESGALLDEAARQNLHQHLVAALDQK